MRKPLLVTAVSVLAVCLMSLALFAVACGSSSTTTTADDQTTLGGATTTADDQTTTTAGVTTTAGGATTTVAAIDGAALYAQNCVGCHKNGVDGSADDVAAIVRSGKDSMPSFTDKLSADEITALAAYAAGGGK